MLHSPRVGQALSISRILSGAPIAFTRGASSVPWSLRHCPLAEDSDQVASSGGPLLWSTWRGRHPVCSRSQATRGMLRCSAHTACTMFWLRHQPPRQPRHRRPSVCGAWPTSPPHHTFVVKDDSRLSLMASCSRRSAKGSSHAASIKSSGSGSGAHGALASLGLEAEPLPRRPSASTAARSQGYSS